MSEFVTDRRTVRASGPDDLLALVPGLIGFHPEDSVVMLTVGGARQPVHARVDLPDLDEIDHLAEHLTDVAVRSGVASVVVVAYTDDDTLASLVVDSLDEAMLTRDVELVCAVRADGRRWWLVGARPDTPGTTYDVRSHPLMAQAVLEGTVVLGSREELVASLVGDPEETEEIAELAEAEVARLATAWVEDGHRGRREHHLEVEVGWVVRRVERFLADGLRLEAGDVARLLVLMAVSVTLRDLASAQMTPVDAGRHVDLWRDLARRSPQHLRGAPAALLAFAAWLSGHGALAWCAVECAEKADPGNRLAGLVARALEGAVPPSAWRPAGPGSAPLADA